MKLTKMRWDWRVIEEETKKNKKLETPPHKYVLKKVSVTISFNLYKY